MKVKMLLGIAALVVALGGIVEAKEEINPATISINSAILISKGKTVVTQADFEAQLEELTDAARENVRHDKSAIKKILEDLYVRKTMAQEARDAKLDQDPLVRNRMALTVDKLLAQVRLDAVGKEAPRPDFEEMVKERYLAYPEKVEIPAQVRASHILITTKGRTEEDAKKLAEKVRAEALEGKQSFAELAKKYSEDPSAGTNQGDLGFFGPGMMVKAFDEAAYALKKTGDISPLVKTEFGFHIIRLEDRKPARKRAFDEVKADMLREAEQKYLADVRGRYMAGKNSPEGVDVNLEAIEKLYIPIPQVPVGISSKGTQPKTEAKQK